jgi:hypothetical protein
MLSFGMLKTPKSFVRSSTNLQKLGTALRAFSRAWALIRTAKYTENLKTPESIAGMARVLTSLSQDMFCMEGMVNFSAVNR